MTKKNKLAVPKDSNCLNCGYPFTGHELFCPDCGQKNKGSKITFSSFIREVFAGFFSWDTKFWRTLFTLISKPGKISRDYIGGKRQRYANPFRFYITASILFFLFYGINETIANFEALTKTSSFKKETETNISLDSVNSIIKKEIKKSNFKLDSTQLAAIANSEITKKDSVATKKPKFYLGGDTRLDQFISFNQKNPDIDINSALDSLNYPKTFWNRFFYNRAELVNSFRSDKSKGKEFVNKMLSYGSISLFIFLPIFTLALKLLYVRRRFTYVEHLIFVFHTQTVFFLLLSVLMIVNFFTKNIGDNLFIGLFSIYLFIAMKNFYQQGYIKTIIKFILINSVYLFLAVIGISLVGIVSFALL